MTDQPKPGRLSTAHALSELLVAATTPDCDPHKLVSRLRKLADWIEAGAPPKVTKPRDQILTSAEVHEVFGYYCQAFKRTASYQLTEERAKLIKARLADGMTVERCKRSIDGLKASPWHNGKNDDGTRYLELEHVFRNTAKAEQMASNAPSPKQWLKPEGPEKSRPEPVADPETAREKAAELAKVIGRIGRVMP